MNQHSDPITIVEADLHQLELLVPLFDGYRQFYRQPSNLPAARQFLLDRMTRAESIIFLALAGSAAMGFTQLYPSFSSVSLRRLWILNDLFVDPAARKRGVATALLTRARNFAQANGAKGLVLETAVDNPARRLYEELGWRSDEGSVHYALTF